MIRTGTKEIAGTVLLAGMVALLLGCQMPSSGVNKPNKPTDQPAGSPGPYFLKSSALGTFDAHGPRIWGVPYGTTASQLMAAVTAVDGVTLAVLDHSGGSAVANPGSTYMEAPLVLRGTLPDGSKQECSIEMEYLTNQAVLVVDGSVSRISLQFLEDATLHEWVLKDAASASAFRMTEAIIDGTYTAASDTQGRSVRLALEGIPGLPKAATVATDTRTVLTLNSGRGSGRMVGHLDTGAALLVWFRSALEPDLSFDQVVTDTVARSSVLSSPNSAIRVEVTPHGPSLAISMIRFQFQFLRADNTGDVVAVAGTTHPEVDYGFSSTITGAKTVEFPFSQFNIDPHHLAVWQQGYTKLKITTVVGYTGFEFVDPSVEVTIPLVQDLPAMEGVVYDILGDVDFSALTPPPGSLPRDQWRVALDQIEDYPGGLGTLSTGWFWLNLVSSTIVPAFNGFRSAAEAHEHWTISLDTTGDGVADRVWAIPDFSVVNGHGPIVECFIDETGELVFL